MDIVAKIKEVIYLKPLDFNQFIKVIESIEISDLRLKVAIKIKAISGLAHITQQYIFVGLNRDDNSQL